MVQPWERTFEEYDYPEMNVPELGELPFPREQEELIKKTSDIITKMVEEGRLTANAEDAIIDRVSRQISESAKYFTGLRQYLEGQKKAGVYDRKEEEDKSQERVEGIYQAAIEQLVSGGLTSKLPYFDPIQKGLSYAEEKNISYGKIFGTGVTTDFKADWADILAKPDLSYNQKVKQLSDLIYWNPRISISLRDKLRRRAENDVFETLSPEEQQKRMWEQEDIRRGYTTTVTPWTAPEFKDVLPTLPSSNFRNWFRQRYPAIVREFKSELTGEQPLKEVEARWAALLKRKTPELREEYEALPYWERGERPQVFQPRIKTVQW